MCCVCVILRTAHWICHWHNVNICSLFTLSAWKTYTQLKNTTIHCNNNYNNHISNAIKTTKKLELLQIMRHSRLKSMLFKSIQSTIRSVRIDPKPKQIASTTDPHAHVHISTCLTTQYNLWVNALNEHSKSAEIDLIKSIWSIQTFSHCFHNLFSIITMLGVCHK